MIIQAIGVTSCLGGPKKQCAHAAEMLHHEYVGATNPELQFQWHMLHPDNKGSQASQLIRLNKTVSQFSAMCLTSRAPFLVVGGDHSCALGTWGGILNALDDRSQLGLIWLDAHLDAHTFSTSPSGYLHGMPVAALLGHTDKKLAGFYPSNRFVDPQNLKMIGIRSYEKEEYQLLQQHGVAITLSKQIDNLAELLITTVKQLSDTCQYIGISIDLDVVDPQDAPGVETPVGDGVKAETLIHAISNIRQMKKICALEISEFNPENDIHNKTLHLMKRLVDEFFQGQIHQ
jgi:arginase